ncbi:MAG: phosphatidate cytidylyltransferase [Christensenellaceae bacterium]|jgi:phosphatidate cytidylyltransferase|nr:phosphatidate cytidylyltransferase [Christensenellaceae bacterium]
MKRTLTGLLLFAFFLGIVFLTKIHHIFFDILILAVLGFALFEMIKCGRESGFNPIIIPLIITSIGMLPAVYFLGIYGFIIVIIVGLLLVFGFFVFDQKFNFKDFLYSVFILFYPLVMLSIAFLIPRMYATKPLLGMLPILIPIGAAFCSDTFAYYFGSLFKGPHIFPNISPNKTISGCIMGLVGGMVGSILVYLLFEVLGLPVNATIKFSDLFKNPIAFYLLTGLFLSFVSQIGDLAASRIKRQLEIKDFSTILGSHGGVMDRIDSVLFSLAAMILIIISFVSYV